MLRVRSLCVRVFRSFLELSIPAKPLAFRFPSRIPVAVRQNINSNQRISPRCISDRSRFTFAPPLANGPMPVDRVGTVTREKKRVLIFK